MCKSKRLRTLEKKKLIGPQKYQCFSSDRLYVRIGRCDSRLKQFQLPKKCVLKDGPTQSLKKKNLSRLILVVIFRFIHTD